MDNMNVMAHARKLLKENVLAERPGVPKMYVKYAAVEKKVKELQDKQLELAQPYFAAKEAGDTEGMQQYLAPMKANQAELNKWRAQLQKIEDKYISQLDADTELNPEKFDQ